MDLELVIVAQAAIPTEPRKGAFHDLWRQRMERTFMIAGFLDQKGGVGKSTLAISVAAFLRGNDVESTPKTPAPKGEQSKFSVYLPDELHMRYKVLCVRRKVSMTGDVRAFIEKRVAELEAE